MSKNSLKNGANAPIVVSEPSKDGASGAGKLFTKLAKATSRQAGRAWVFALATGTVVVWATTGPFFNFSDTWQLVINTGNNLFDGLFDPKFSKPGFCSHSSEAR